jgi:hypothetical protein
VVGVVLVSNADTGFAGADHRRTTTAEVLHNE